MLGCICLTNSCAGSQMGADSCLAQICTTAVAELNALGSPRRLCQNL